MKAKLHIRNRELPNKSSAQLSFVFFLSFSVMPCYSMLFLCMDYNRSIFVDDFTLACVKGVRFSFSALTHGRGKPAESQNIDGLNAKEAIHFTDL